MTRVLSYNILLGGTRRIAELAAIIQTAKPDIVGLAEATNPHVVEELAQRLGMQFCLSGRSRHTRDWNLCVLSRLPIVHTKVHTHPGVFTRKHLLEVGIEEEGGTRLTVFVTHLTSNFFRGVKSVQKRRREVEAILEIASAYHGEPHVIMGDFNSISPGEDFQGSALLRYFRSQRGSSVPHPEITDGIEYFRYLLKRVLRLGIYSPFLIPMADRVSQVYALGGIDLMERAGYIDTFRQLHAEEAGFTFHSAKPVGRIDYIFASPELASRLVESGVITEGEGVRSSQASDHCPIFAEFIKMVPM